MNFFEGVGVGRGVRLDEGVAVGGKPLDVGVGKGVGVPIGDLTHSASVGVAVVTWAVTTEGEAKGISVSPSSMLLIRPARG